MALNSNCQQCDYRETCQKKVVVYGKGDKKATTLAKMQDVIQIRCVCSVHDICRDCIHFARKKCASWKVLNGRELSRGALVVCPKKVREGK